MKKVFVFCVIFLILMCIASCQNPNDTENISSNFYLDGKPVKSIPEKGDYSVYAFSNVDGRLDWDHDSWQLADSSKADNFKAYFFSVSAVFSSVDQLKNSDRSFKSGELVATEAYHHEKNAGGAIYRITDQASEHTIELKNGKYALVLPFDIENEKIISVDMFGTFADGKNDDAEAINSAFSYADYTIVQFECDQYLQKDGILLSKNGVTVNGNGATISNEYTDGEVHWADFEICDSENIILQNLTLYLSETKGMGTLFKRNDHVQLLVRKAQHITVDSVDVICPDNSAEDRHVTSIWANGSINDITIQYCTVKNFSKSTVGGGIWVSAGENTTAHNIKITDNHIEKSSHDETLAFFIGDFDNVLVEWNYIYSHDEPRGNASAHAIGFGVNSIATTVKNAVFSNNTVDVVSSLDAITFASVDGLKIFDNDITYRSNGTSDPISYAVFRVSQPEQTYQKDLEIYNNDIKVINYYDNTMAGLVYNLGAGCSVYDNTFSMSSYVSKITAGTVTDVSFHGNTVIFEKGFSASYDKYKYNNEIIIK